MSSSSAAASLSILARASRSSMFSISTWQRLRRMRLKVTVLKPSLNSGSSLLSLEHIMAHTGAMAGSLRASSMIRAAMPRRMVAEVNMKLGQDETLKKAITTKWTKYGEVVKAARWEFHPLAFAALGMPSKSTLTKLYMLFGVRVHPETQKVVKATSWLERQAQRALEEFLLQLSGVCFKNSAESLLWHATGQRAVVEGKFSGLGLL